MKEKILFLLRIYKFTGHKLVSKNMYDATFQEIFLNTQTPICHSNRESFMIRLEIENLDILVQRTKVSNICLDASLF